MSFSHRNVETDIKTFDFPLDKIEKHGTPTQPKSVFLFSGHMVDSPDRTEKRFPNDKKYIDIARNAIAVKLNELDASKDDLALCGVHVEEICFSLNPVLNVIYIWR